MANRPLSYLHLPLTTDTTPSFKRSFEEYGFDLEAPLSDGVGGSGSGSASGSGNERNKRARSESSSTASDETLESSGSSAVASAGSSDITSAEDDQVFGLSATPPISLTDHAMSDVILSSRPPTIPTPPSMDSPMPSLDNIIPVPPTDHDERYRASLDRFNAFDSEMAALRRTPLASSPSPPSMFSPYFEAAAIDDRATTFSFGDFLATPNSSTTSARIHPNSVGLDNVLSTNVSQEDSPQNGQVSATLRPGGQLPRLSPIPLFSQDNLEWWSTQLSSDSPLGPSERPTQSNEPIPVPLSFTTMRNMFDHSSERDGGGLPRPTALAIAQRRAAIATSLRRASDLRRRERDSAVQSAIPSGSRPQEQSERHQAILNDLSRTGPHSAHGEERQPGISTLVPPLSFSPVDWSPVPFEQPQSIPSNPRTGSLPDVGLSIMPDRSDRHSDLNLRVSHNRVGLPEIETSARDRGSMDPLYGQIYSPPLHRTINMVARAEYGPVNSQPPRVEGPPESNAYSSRPYSHRISGPDLIEDGRVAPNQSDLHRVLLSRMSGRLMETRANTDSSSSTSPAIAQRGELQSVTPWSSSSTMTNTMAHHASSLDQRRPQPRLYSSRVNAADASDLNETRRQMARSRLLEDLPIESGDYSNNEIPSRSRHVTTDDVALRFGQGSLVYTLGSRSGDGQGPLGRTYASSDSARGGSTGRATSNSFRMPETSSLSRIYQDTHSNNHNLDPDIWEFDDIDRSRNMFVANVPSRHASLDAGVGRTSASTSVFATPQNLPHLVSHSRTVLDTIPQISLERDSIHEETGSASPSRSPTAMENRDDLGARARQRLSAPTTDIYRSPSPPDSLHELSSNLTRATSQAAASNLNLNAYRDGPFRSSLRSFANAERPQSLLGPLESAAYDMTRSIRAPPPPVISPRLHTFRRLYNDTDATDSSNQSTPVAGPHSENIHFPNMYREARRSRNEASVGPDTSRNMANPIYGVPRHDTLQSSDWPRQYVTNHSTGQGSSAVPLPSTASNSRSDQPHQQRQRYAQYGNLVQSISGNSVSSSSPSSMRESLETGLRTQNARLQDRANQRANGMSTRVLAQMEARSLARGEVRLRSEARGHFGSGGVAESMEILSADGFSMPTHRVLLDRYHSEQANPNSDDEPRETEPVFYPASRARFMRRGRFYRPADGGANTGTAIDASTRNNRSSSHSPVRGSSSERLAATAAVLGDHERRWRMRANRTQLDRPFMQEDFPRFGPLHYSRLGRLGRSLGDYMRDEDFDSSYENLVSLASTLGEVRPKATPKHVVANLPNGLYKNWRTPDSDERCPICLDDYKDSDPVLKLIDCSHWLHKGCLEQWLHGANTCPVCREQVGVSECPHFAYGSRASVSSVSGSGTGTGSHRTGLPDFLENDDDSDDSDELEGIGSDMPPWRLFD